MQKILVSIIILLTFNYAKCQLPYSQNQFMVRTESNLIYGISPSFAGIQDTLRLDLYKPIGDNNCRRPCLVLVHGGAWIAGSKEDALIVSYANEFAKKGWMVATINYRLGMHKTSNYTQYAICNSSINQPCGYVADTAEVIRANFRGQQDAKDAIRFLKERHASDSTDYNNFFIAGESAGGFIALASTFYDKDTEKPLDCEGIAAAPTPDTDLASCLPANYSLLRPNLNDIQGNHNFGNYNAKVEGVGCLYGGLFDFSAVDNTSNWPVMYIFHQGSDVVVNYNRGRLLGRIDWECYAQSNVCQLYANYPIAYGGKAMKLFFEDFSTNGPTVVADIVENYEYLNDCFDNGHSVDMPVVRADAMATLFAQRVADNGNFPGVSCNVGLLQIQNNPVLTISPNPSEGIVYIESTGADAIKIYNALGKLVFQVKIEVGQNKIDLTKLGRGVFMIQSENNPSSILRLVIR